MLERSIVEDDTLRSVVQCAPGTTMQFLLVFFVGVLVGGVAVGAANARANSRATHVAGAEGAGAGDLGAHFTSTTATAPAPQPQTRHPPGWANSGARTPVTSPDPAAAAAAPEATAHAEAITSSSSTTTNTQPATDPLFRHRLPRFTCLPKTPPEEAMDKGRVHWSGIACDSFKRHPLVGGAYVDDDAQAEIVLATIGRYDSPGFFGRLFGLPQRPSQSPWAVHAAYVNFVQCLFKQPPQPFCTQVGHLVRRTDILFVSMDLRDHYRINMSPWERSHPEISESDLDKRPKLRGVSFLGGCRRAASDCDRLDSSTKYLLAFRGLDDGRKPVRALVKKAFQGVNISRVVVEIPRASRLGLTPSDKARYSDLVTNTSYSLQLRGHGRWLTRTIHEMCVANVIPVIISDGWTLPMEELVNWTDISIRVPQKFAGSHTTILDKLPRDPTVITQMRRRVCNTIDTYFNGDRQLYSLLVSLKVRKNIPGTLAPR